MPEHQAEHVEHGTPTFLVTVGECTCRRNHAWPSAVMIPQTGLPVEVPEDHITSTPNISFGRGGNAPQERPPITKTTRKQTCNPDGPSRSSALLTLRASTVIRTRANTGPTSFCVSPRVVSETRDDDRSRHVRERLPVLNHDWHRQSVPNRATTTPDPVDRLLSASELPGADIAVRP
jgi:hypothetical protein